VRNRSDDTIWEQKRNLLPPHLLVAQSTAK